MVFFRIRSHFLGSLVDFFHKSQQRMWILWHIKVGPCHTLDLSDLSRRRFRMVFMCQQERPVDIWRSRDRLVRSDVKVKARDRLFRGILAASRGD